jgi:hypothetical protein
MTAKPSSCPYCNSLVPVPLSAAPGQRLVCPRCDESFLYRNLEGNGQGAIAEEATGGTPRPDVVEVRLHRRRGWSNGALARLVLLVMGSMAVIGLAFALWTVQDRRSHDRKPTEPEVVLTRTVAPAKLPGLGYLPPDTDLIAAVHVAEVLQDPTGRELLSQFRPAQGIRGGQADVSLSMLEHWLGLSVDDLDYLLLGLNVTNRLIPRTTLIVQTRRPYDAERVRATLKATRTGEPGPKPVYRFTLDKPPLDVWLCFLAERTLVIGLAPADVAVVPPTPQDIGHLPKSLQTMLTERLGSVAPIWVIGHSEDWDKTSLRLPLSSVSATGRPLLEKVRSFGVWLQIGHGWTLNGACRCADPATAEKLANYLVPPEGEPQPLLLFGKQEQTKALARELGQSLKATTRDDWVTIQAKATAATLRESLAAQP